MRLKNCYRRLITFVLAKEPILQIANSRLLVLILFRSENTAFIKRALRSSILSHLAPYSLRHWWSDVLPSINCGCLLRVLRRSPLHFMSSNTNRGLRPQTHLHSQLFLRSLSPTKTRWWFFASFCRSNHFSWPAKIIEASAQQKRSRQKTCRWTSVSDAWGEIGNLCSWWWLVLTRL